jgi:peptidoglycan/LPS O-acetylase OafA/YrhL
LASRNQIESLTGLRFIAAFSVALTHGVNLIFPWAGAPVQWYNLLRSAAGIGMPIFFVLSGFIIHYNYSKSINDGGPRSLFNFYIARFSRIYPLYIIGVSLDVFINIYHGRPISLQEIPYFITMTQSWFYQIRDGHSFIGAFGHVSAVAWSVSTEWFFYVAYPAVCLAIAKLKSSTARAIALCALITFGLGSMAVAIANIDTINAHAVAVFGPVAGGGPYGEESFFRWFIYISPYSRIFEFILGCVIASIFMNSSDTPNQRLGRILTVASIIWTASWYYIMFGIGIRGIPWIDTISIMHLCFGYAPGIGLLIYCCARYDNAVTRLLSSKTLVLCGEASYSLYLLHLILVVKFASYSAPATSFLVAAGDAARLCVCLIACVGLSLVTWRIIEVPARNAIRHLLTPRKVQKLTGGEPAHS